jgi:hypothetical protein
MTESNYGSALYLVSQPQLVTRSEEHNRLDHSLRYQHSVGADLSALTVLQINGIQGIEHSLTMRLVWTGPDWGGLRVKLECRRLAGRDCD